MPTPTNQDYVVARVDKARLLLAEAKTPPAAKQIVDMARAAEVYAKRQKLSQETIQYATTIKFDAMALLGELLKAAPKNTGTKGQLKGDIPKGGKVVGGSHLTPPTSTSPTYADLGISKKEASEAQALAKLKKELPDEWGGVRTGSIRLMEARRASKLEEVKQKAQLPSGKYRVFYADPPWKYGDQLTPKYGSTKYHYQTMSIAELCAMPIVDRAEKDAVLFIWVTAPILFECFPVIQAWGFVPKASFVWDKVKSNWGHYNSVRHEFLLICTRGSCQPDTKKQFDSVQSIERGKHSAKPEEFRKIIEELYPYGKRLELFGRAKVKNWDVYGDQVAG